MTQRFVAVLLLAGSCLAQTADHKEVNVTPDILARYVGIYAMAPTVNMTITLVDGHLVSRVTARSSSPACSHGSCGVASISRSCLALNGKFAS